MVHKGWPSKLADRNNNKTMDEACIYQVVYCERHSGSASSESVFCFMGRIDKGRHHIPIDVDVFFFFHAANLRGALFTYLSTCFSRLAGRSGLSRIYSFQDSFFLGFGIGIG